MLVKTFSVSQLARLAECEPPLADDSPGGEYLAAVRDAVAAAKDRGVSPNVELLAFAPLPMGEDIWFVFVDLAAFREVEAGPVDDFREAAAFAVASIGERLVRALLAE